MSPPDPFGFEANAAPAMDTNRAVPSSTHARRRATLHLLIDRRGRTGLNRGRAPPFGVGRHVGYGRLGRPDCEAHAFVRLSCRRHALRIRDGSRRTAGDAAGVGYGPPVARVLVTGG